MESNFEWITANGDIGIRFFHSIDDGGYSNPPHWHNDLEIIYLLEGRLKVRFGDGGERQIGADELLVINSGTIHAVTAYPNQAIGPAGSVRDAAAVHGALRSALLCCG